MWTGTWESVPSSPPCRGRRFWVTNEDFVTLMTYSPMALSQREQESTSLHSSLFPKWDFPHPWPTGASSGFLFIGALSLVFLGVSSEYSGGAPCGDWGSRHPSGSGRRPLLLHTRSAGSWAVRRTKVAAVPIGMFGLASSLPSFLHEGHPATSGPIETHPTCASWGHTCLLSLLRGEDRLQSRTFNVTWSHKWRQVSKWAGFAVFEAEIIESKSSRMMSVWVSTWVG